MGSGTAVTGGKLALFLGGRSSKPKRAFPVPRVRVIRSPGGGQTPPARLRLAGVRLKHARPLPRVRVYKEPPGGRSWRAGCRSAAVVEARAVLSRERAC